MNNLQRVLTEIKNNLPLATENLEDGNMTGHSTLNARRGRQRAAQEKVKTLRLDYMNLLRESAVFLITVGSEKEALAEVLDPGFKCFRADPEQLYKDLVAKVPVSLYGRETTSGLFTLISRHLEDRAIELGVTGMPQMVFKNEYNRHIGSAGDLLVLTKKVINKDIGAELAGIQAVATIVDQAIARDHADRLTPIVLATDDLELANALDDSLTRLTPRVFTLVAGKLPKGVKKPDGAVILKEITEEAVTAAMESIRASLKR